MEKKSKCVRKHLFFVICCGKFPFLFGTEKYNLDCRELKIVKIIEVYEFVGKAESQFLNRVFFYVFAFDFTG